MKIGLYTFGGSNIGTGHLFRSIAFANWLERIPFSLDISFEVINLDPNGIDVALNVLSKRSSIPCNIHKEPGLPGFRWDVLFVDRLRVAPGDMCSLRKRAQKIISVDDVGAGRYLADVAINPLYRKYLSDTTYPSIR